MKLPELLQIAEQYFDCQLVSKGGGVNLTAWMQSLPEETLEKLVEKNARVDLFVERFLSEFDTGIQVQDCEDESMVEQKYQRTYYDVVLDHIKILSKLNIVWQDLTFKSASRIVASHNMEQMTTALYNIKNQLSGEDYGNIEFDIALTDMSDINAVAKLVRNYSAYIRKKRDE